MMSGHQQNRLLVPATEADVTPSWVSAILGVKIEEDSFLKEPNVQLGSGFLSSMIRVNCVSETGAKEYKLIVKLLSEDETMMNLTVSQGFDKREIGFYREIVPDLVELLPDLNHYFCPTYYGHIQEANPDQGVPRASVLVLEDLKPQGYYTINFAKEETSQQVQEVVEFLAKFHFAGIALEHKKGKPLPEVYDCLREQFMEIDVPEAYLSMAKDGFKAIEEMFRSNNVNPTVIEAYKNLEPYSDEILGRIHKLSREHPTLIHGDLWSNNVFFHHDPKHRMKAIDWQLLEYKEPAYDVVASLVGNIPQVELKKEAVVKYLQCYYKTFSNQAKQAGVEHLIIRNSEEFLKFATTWGMTYALLFFVISGIPPYADNIPRLIKMYEFLVEEMNVTGFLLNEFSK